MGSKNNKAVKRFLDNPETKEFAKKFAEDLAEILVDTFKQSKDNKTSYADMEKDIHAAIASKEAEFKEQVEKMTHKVKKENQKVSDKNHLVRVTMRSYSS